MQSQKEVRVECVEWQVYFSQYSVIYSLNSENFNHLSLDNAYKSI